MNIFCFLFYTINGEIMSLKDIINNNIIVCNINDDVSFISSCMRDNDIGFIPIVDRNRIVGVITDRDLACRIFNNELDGNITDYMSRDIVSVDINDSILDVLNKMRKYRIKRIIVTDNNKVIGVVSISDILNIDEFNEEVFNTIKSIWKIGPNIHKYESEVDEFYL